MDALDKGHGSKLCGVDEKVESIKKGCGWRTRCEREDVMVCGEKNTRML